MKKPMTIRLPEKVIRTLEREARQESKEKGTLVRELIEAGLSARREESIARKYAKGEISEGLVCRRLGISRWEFLDFLERHNINRNITMEDWLDSQGICKRKE